MHCHSKNIVNYSALSQQMALNNRNIKHSETDNYMHVTEKKNIKGPTGELTVLNFESSTPIDLSSCLQRRGEKGSNQNYSTHRKKKL